MNGLATLIPVINCRKLQIANRQLEIHCTSNCNLSKLNLNIDPNFVM